MRVAILPPCFYPPRAYFELIRSADLCILHADIMYAKRHPTVRTRLGDGHWLTVPVHRPNKSRQRGGVTPLCKITVLPFDEWLPAHCLRIGQLYGMNIEG